MNNREIKFRAWHRIENKMCEVELLRPEHGALLIGVVPQTNQLVQLGSNTYEVTAPANGRFCDLVEFELMQFTGLTDKMGKEIYCGDVVKYPTGDPDKPFMEETVEFKGGAFYPVCMEPSFNFEIIRNIYETPPI